ncbi:MAG: restriction endonuclease subunit S [Aquificaceae bacterium]
MAEVSSGGSAPQGSVYYGGKNKFVRVSHIENTNFRIYSYDLITDEAVKLHNLKLFPKGTIVFPKSGASVYLEKRARLPFDAYLVSHLCAVNSLDERVAIQDYLFYVLVGAKLAAKKESGYPTLNLSEVRQFPLPLPPLEEQKAIAEVLRRVQESIEKTEEVIRATKELKKSLMKHLFTYGPVPLDEVERVELKDTEIGPLPAHWNVVRLGEVGKISTGNTPSKGNPEYWASGTFDFVKPPDLKNRFISTATEKISEKALSKARIALAGSILVSCIGIIGRVGYTTKPVAFNQQINSITPNSGAYGLYIFHALQHNTVQEVLNSLKSITTVPIVNKSKFETVPLPLPPLEEQKQIASILQAVDEKIQKEEERKRALENLFKSLLHNLMSGKIRVRWKES